MLECFSPSIPFAQSQASAGSRARCPLLSCVRRPRAVLSLIRKTMGCNEKNGSHERRLGTCLFGPKFRRLPPTRRSEMRITKGGTQRHMSSQAPAENRTIDSASALLAKQRSSVCVPTVKLRNKAHGQIRGLVSSYPETLQATRPSSSPRA